ncbi:MAG: hypothetical protein ACR2G6_13375 [Gemmatimonadaceae bacterium]
MSISWAPVMGSDDAARENIAGKRIAGDASGWGKRGAGESARALAASAGRCVAHGK